jgi:hypothetical protein
MNLNTTQLSSGKLPSVLTHRPHCYLLFFRAHLKCAHFQKKAFATLAKSRLDFKHASSIIITYIVNLCTLYPGAAGDQVINYGYYYY